MTNEPLNDTSLIPCQNMKTIARAFDDVTGNNNNVQSMDAQLQVVRGEYQQRYKQFFKENEALQEKAMYHKANSFYLKKAMYDQRLAKDREIKALQQQLANASTSNGVKDQEIANLRREVANANDTIDRVLRTKTYANGNVYVGQMKDDKKHGHGKYTYNSGSNKGNVYVGQWKDDKRDGRGKHTIANGNVYDGQYKGNKRNGIGTYTWANGKVYFGNCENKLRHGYGKITYVEDEKHYAGDVYEGEWENNHRHGKGKYTRADGSTYHDGMWRDHQPVR
jgi:hypothetical protein